MSAPTLERRSFGRPLEVREFKKDGYVGGISGYAVVYGLESRDMGGWKEIITRGAFTDSLKKALDVRMLYQHSSAQIMARESASTLRLSEDEVGVRFEADLVDTMLNRDAFANIRARNLDAMSFGMPYDSVTVRWERSSNKKYDVRHVTKADMLEISVVTWAAYEDTTVAARDHETFRENLSREQSTPADVLRNRLELEKLRHRY